MTPSSSHLLSILLILLLLLVIVSSSTTTEGGQRQNVIFIVADDAGYADFESHDPTMNTSNIKTLREEGVFLNQSYVLPMCTPSRAAWITGRYPHTFGLQDATVNAEMLNWINENFTFLPEEFRRLNYTTHMVGKWHLGFCHPGLTPQGRGFDSFYGFLLGSHTSYYNHTKSTKNYYDWFDNDTVDFSARGHYQTELLSARAVKLIEQDDQRKPFFLYLSYGAPHGPFEVPQWYRTQYCPHITNVSRQIHCGMMAALDKGVGEVVAALKDKGIYDNTFIVFLSDNGGPINGGSVNYPLRAGKKNLFEGGIRSYTIVRGPGFEHRNRPTTWSGLVHAVDWFPTLLGAAGGKNPNYTHGYNMYDSMRNNSESPREDFIIASDFSKFNHTVLRWRQWKLMTAVPGLGEKSRWIPGFHSGWYPPYQLLEQGVPWEDVKVKKSRNAFLLFNIELDPYERNETYKTMKKTGIVQHMKQKLEEYLGVPGVKFGRYPIQPYPLHIPSSNGTNVRDGVYVTCWCQPPGLPACDPSNDGGDDDGDNDGDNNDPNADESNGDTSSSTRTRSHLVTLWFSILVGLMKISK